MGLLFESLSAGKLQSNSFTAAAHVERYVGKAQHELCSSWPMFSEAHKLLGIVGCIPANFFFLRPVRKPATPDFYEHFISLPRPFFFHCQNSFFFHGPEHCTVVLLPLETWAAYLSHICPSIKKTLSSLLRSPVASHRFVTSSQSSSSLVHPLVSKIESKQKRTRPTQIEPAADAPLREDSHCTAAKGINRTRKLKASAAE